jgi:hypothetical protein
VAIGYRIFSALRWGQLGDGHITARDPERPDHFWVLGHGIPFWAATVDNLALVGPDGSVVDGPAAGGINYAAHNIHWPILAARPDLVSAAHTHTQFGTPWSANVRPFRPISQEACVFVYDQSIYRGEDLEVATMDGLFVMAERVAEVHVKAPDAVPISDDAAKAVEGTMGCDTVGWRVFQWLARDLVPDPSVVLGD